ncbi:hypothetical protein PJN92_28780, partial [Mycobacterium kansasii]
ANNQAGQDELLDKNILLRLPGGGGSSKFSRATRSIDSTLEKSWGGIGDSVICGVALLPRSGYVRPVLAVKSAPKLPRG